MTSATPPPPRLEPIFDWIGDLRLEHGERGELDPEHDSACLCGAPYYLHCDGWLNGGGLSDVVLAPPPTEKAKQRAASVLETDFGFEPKEAALAADVIVETQEQS